MLGREEEPVLLVWLMVLIPWRAVIALGRKHLKNIATRFYTKYMDMMLGSIQVRCVLAAADVQQDVHS